MGPSGFRTYHNKTLAIWFSPQPHPAFGKNSFGRLLIVYSSIKLHASDDNECSDIDGVSFRFGSKMDL